jgi:hypothetical protein
MECIALKVEKDYRVFLPQAVLKRASWISGTGTVSGWLVVGGSGRFRLLSSAEAEGDAGCQSLRDEIDAEAGRPIGSAIEFSDEASALVGLRLLPVEIAPPGPGWRLTLPRAIAMIMGIRPKEHIFAVLPTKGHIEFWTQGAVHASLTTSLTDLV